MFKNKFFLNGLGIGLIAGAILLQLVLYAEPIDEKALLVKVDKLGYTVVKKQIKEGSNLQNDTSVLSLPVTPTPSSTQTNAPAETPLPTLSPTTIPIVSESPTPTAKASPKATATPSPTSSSKQISINIPPGTGSGAVGKMLVQKKIIADVIEFDKVLEKRKLTDHIQPGTFVFTGTEKLDEVITKITTVK